MTYYILCPSFKHAILASKTFANHYSENDMAIVKRQTEVKIGENLFVFINKNDPRTTRGIHGELIPLDKFMNKYFTPK